MARMIFGPWKRPHEIPHVPHEALDVTSFDGHPRWIKDHMVECATPTAAGWKRPNGQILEYRVSWVRRRDWAEPLDIDVSGVGHRESVDLELRQDGSAVIRMYKGSDGVVGEITIAAADLETVAQWFTKAVEANKQ